jgi:hypothetical protein
MNATCLTLGLLLCGQPEPDEAALKEILVPFYAHEAAEYEIFRDEERKERLEARTKPLLTWTNSENYMGSVFIWEFAGRPEMIGCIGSHQNPNRPGRSNFFHELHSLSTRPLQPVKFGGGPTAWEVTEPGLKLTAIGDAPEPASSAPARLTQMRNIAREFRGWMKDNEDVTELRLLTQPIARYSAPDSGVTDGAIFAFVWKGTDPEILLVLEDRKAAGAGVWHWGMARFNFREMWAERSDKEVWRVEVARRTGNYITGITGEHTHDEIRGIKE